MPLRRGRPAKHDVLKQTMDQLRIETAGDLEDAYAFRECRGVLVIVRSLADHLRWAHGAALDLLKQAACADVLLDLYAYGHADEVPLDIYRQHLMSPRPLGRCEQKGCWL